MRNNIIIKNSPEYVTDFIAGSIVKCAEAPATSSNLGDILMVTSSKENPLINLRTGLLWGDRIEEYRFTLISKPGSNITITPFDNV